MTKTKRGAGRISPVLAADVPLSDSGPLAYADAAASRSHLLRTALSEWKGAWDFDDMHALNLIAWQPQMRRLVFTLGHLPGDVQAKAVEFLSSLARMKPEAPRSPSSSFNPTFLWEQQRGVSDVSTWSLPALVVGLRQQFDPLADEEASPERLTELIEELQRRGFDALAIIRGPILRRTARLLSERRRLDVARRSDAGRISPDLQQWLGSNAATSSYNWGNRLWAYWASLSPADAQQLPPPPRGGEYPQPNINPLVEWFFVRCTEARLRNWPQGALEFELRTNQDPPPAPWSAAAELSTIDPSAVLTELERRQRTARALDEPEPQSEFVASSLLSSAYHAFIEGRRQEAQQFARAAVERYPTVADGYNSLGFMLMVDRKFDEAMLQFSRAQQLDFEQRDLLAFNRACCEYMIGNFTAALTAFREAISRPMEEAVLCLLSDDELYPISLDTPAEFIALAALNAAWSAMRAQQPESAREYLAIAAGAGQLHFDPEPVGGQVPAAQLFDESRRRLGEKLAKG